MLRASSTFERANHNALLKVLLNERVNNHQRQRRNNHDAVLHNIGRLLRKSAGVATHTCALLEHLVDDQNLPQNQLQRHQFALGSVDQAGEEIVPVFNLSAANNPSNWLGPIWLVANYVAFRGLLNYGLRDQAALLCERSVRLLDEDLRATGSLHEYYNPFTGKPVMNGGFVNWNILALNMIEELRGKPAINLADS